MKISLLLINLLVGIGLIHAQANPIFEAKNVLLQQDFYHEALGTTGLLLSFEYLYTSPNERLSLQYPTINLYQNGTNVYTEQQQVLALKANVWSKASLFIPYRKINLYKGKQEAVMLSIKINDWWAYNKNISYQQPRRFKVDIQVRKGEVKQKLLPYDEGGMVQERLPDPYFTLTTNGGIRPIYQSKVLFNQYQIPSPAISIYVLEGEQLQWSFYDRDGAEDELLGVYNDFEQESTVYEDYYGLMFGAIKNLDFTYSRKVQAPQAINIYSDATYRYQGKKGVALTIKYDLPEAFIGQKAQPIFDFYDKNGIRLDIPLLYPLNGAVALGDEMALLRRGQVQYFIPFYLWKAACQAIEFSFLRKDGEQARAARHIVRQEIAFDDLVIQSDLLVQEQVLFQGARGIGLTVDYSLLEMYENSPLYVKFSRPDGSPLPFKVYSTKNESYGYAIGQEHKIEQPKIADKLSYFIPYSVLEDDTIAVRADLVPDVAIAILEQFTPRLTGKGKDKDVELKVAKAESRFQAGNYGQVIQLKVDVPLFYRNTSQLYLAVKENGKRSDNILVEGAKELGDNKYMLTNDSGSVYLIIPYRRIQPSVDLEVEAYAFDAAQGQRKMSEVLEWNWKAPKELFNIPIEVELLACKFDKKVAKDTSLAQNFPWRYQIITGHELAAEFPLTQKFRRDKKQFNKSINVNREDNITIQLFNTKNKRKIIIWKGDLSKWQQSDFKAIIEKKYPVKIAKITAKVPPNYNKNSG
jgi:hypothetical protein